MVSNSPVTPIGYRTMKKVYLGEEELGLGLNAKDFTVFLRTKSRLHKTGASDGENNITQLLT